jgi:TPR repeat protein
MAKRPNRPGSVTIVNWAAEPDLDQLRRAYRELATNPSQALHDLEELADRGSQMSMRYIAQAYKDGTEVTRDLDQAEAWYRRAINAGSTHSMHSLGLLYLYKKEYLKAIEEFSAAVSKNSSPSMYILGRMYFRGEGVDRNISAARNLWENGVTLGHIPSRRHLADLLMTGQFGILQILRGVWLWISGVIQAFFILMNDPGSERLLY